MKQNFNRKNILRAAGFWLGLPLLIFIGISGLLLGQIAVIGIADRFGVSPVISFNVLTIFLLGLIGTILFFPKSRPDIRRFFNLPGFGLPAFRLRFWRLPKFNGQSSATEDALTFSATERAADTVCKILFIHHQSAAVAQNVTAECSDFDHQIPEKAYEKTNNL